MNLRRRAVNLRRPERARNEGSTGPERLEPSPLDPTPARDVLLEDMEREKDKFRRQLREETRAIEQVLQRERERCREKERKRWIVRERGS